MEQLLEPGWAGALTIKEAEFIADHLAVDTKLRRAWKIRKRKRYPLQLIAEKALPQNPAEGRRLMENLLQVRSEARSHPGRPGRGKKRGSRVADAPVAPVQLSLS